MPLVKGGGFAAASSRLCLRPGGRQYEGANFQSIGPANSPTGDPRPGGSGAASPVRRQCRSSSRELHIDPGQGMREGGGWEAMQEHRSGGANRQGSSRTLGAMSLTVELPDEIAARVRAVAADRGVSADQIVAEAVSAQLPEEEAPDEPRSDEAHVALKAFIGFGASGTTRPFDIHEERKRLAERKYAEDLAKRTYPEDR